MDYIADLYKENSPEFIYYLTLYNIFNEFLEDISEPIFSNKKNKHCNYSIYFFYSKRWVKAEYIDKTMFTSMEKDIIEIQKLLASIIITTKKK